MEPDPINSPRYFFVSRSAREECNGKEEMPPRILEKEIREYMNELEAENACSIAIQAISHNWTTAGLSALVAFKKDNGA